LNQLTNNSYDRLYKFIQSAFRLNFWPIYAVMAILVTSFLLLVLAAQSVKTPLLNNAEWENRDGFLVMQPDRLNSFLSDGLIKQKTEILINQKPPKYQTFAGALESPPFNPPAHMVIPIKGLVYSVPGHGAKQFDERGGSIKLRCLENQNYINILKSPSQDWFEKSVSLPKNWCNSKVKLELKVTEPDIFVGVGTPYAVSGIYAMVAGKLNVFTAFGVATFFVFLLMVPFLLITELSYLTRGALALLALSFYGYFSYVMQAVNIPQFFIFLFNIIFLSMPVILFKKAYYKGMTNGFSRQLSKICLSWLVLATFIILPIIILPIDSGAWTFNFSFYPVTLSTDNQLPVGMARYVMETKDIQPPGIGPWSITDRGFLPAGLIAGELSSLKLLGLLSNNPIIYLVAQMMVSLANATILLLLFQFPVFKKITYLNVVKITVVICATPFFFFNIVYAWPKMIAGTLMLWSIIIMAKSYNESNYKQLYLVPMLIVAGCLCHSSNLLLVPFIALYALIVLLKEGRDLHLNHTDMLVVLISTIFSIALYEYHNSFGQKSSYGITFVLTGGGIFGLNNHQQFEYLLKFFNQMTLPWYLEHKLEQLNTLIWPPFKEIFYEKNILAQLRTAEFYSAIPSIFMFAPSILLIKQLRNKAFPKDCKYIGTALTIAGCTVVSLLIFSSFPFIVHHLPYMFLLSVLLLAVLQANFDSRIVNIIILVHMSAFLATWVFGSWWIWTFSH
jgi:hypothetical protein